VHYSAIFCHSLDGLLEEEGGEDSGSMCNISAGTTHCGNAVTELGDNTCTFSCKCDCNECFQYQYAYSTHTDSEHRVYVVKQYIPGIYAVEHLWFGT